MSTPPLEQHVDELLAAIAASSPGHETLWEHHGVQVTVYGQARYAMEKPTPWAVIKLNGRQRAFFTWEQVVSAAEELAAQRQTE